MAEHEPTIPLRYATERVLRPRLSFYHFIMAFPGLCLVGAGAFMGFDGAPSYWILFVVVGFGCLAFPLIHLLPGACSVCIGDAGFSVRQWFRPMPFRWDDVVRLEVVTERLRRGGRISFVGVTCKTDPHDRGLSRQQRRKLARQHPSPHPQYFITAEDFGMTPEALVSLLEHYRQQHTGTEGVELVSDHQPRQTLPRVPPPH